MNDLSIDKIRNSAGRMQIGTPDDHSDITTMLSLGDNLYVVKARGIYAVKLADQIDPARTNASIPAVQQQIVSLGSESHLVGQTLLTAKALFSEQVMPKWFDCTNAILCSLEALKDLAAMQELKDAFVEAEEREVVAFRNQMEAKGALVLPAIRAVDTRCKTFFQKADHTIRNLLNIVKQFYKKHNGVNGFDDLIRYARTYYGDNDLLVTYLDRIDPTLKFVRKTRNCLEHPNPPANQVIIADFTLLPDGKIARPSIEVISRPNHYPKQDVSHVMSDLALALPQIFEGVVACLCSKHIERVGGFSPFLINVDSDQRRGGEKHVQYGYGIQIGDSVARFG